MSDELSQKQWGSRLIALCFLVYFISYFTRYSYAASLPELEKMFTKTAASLAVTGSFITYGLGQTISGLLGDRFRPRALITLGLSVTTVCNLLLPNCVASVPLMVVVWCINGFAQSMLWPPIIRLLAESLPTERYKNACTVVSIGSSLGTMCLYLAAAGIIHFATWQFVFRVAAALCLAVIVIWLLGTHSLYRRIVANVDFAQNLSAPEEQTVHTEKLGKLILTSGLAFMAFSMIMEGVLKDGLQSYTPLLIEETFSLASDGSLALTMVLPLFSIAGISLGRLLNRRVRSETVCASLLFGIGFVCSGILALTLGKSVWLTLACIAITVGCMHGANLMLVGQVPVYFAKYGRSATVSGGLNTFTYVGSATSTFGIAAITDASNSWTAAAFCFAGATLLGTLACLASIRPWKRFIRRDKA